MKRPWEAEQIVELEAALCMIAKQFPSLKPQKIRLLGIGWDNTAYLVDETLVFRFPRRQFAVPLLENEYHMLPQIAEHLPLAIPNPRWMGAPSQEYPWPFIGHQILPGTTACRADLSEEERASLAAPLARFLAALHRIPLAIAQEKNLSGDLLGRLNIARITPLLRKNLEEINSMNIGLILPSKEIQELMEERKVFKIPENSTIVHGDFYVRHLLVNEKRQLSGIIDWGDIHIGDPAVDLAIVHNFLPKIAHDAFCKIYGEISEDTWELARFRALYHCTILIIYGHHSGDVAIYREGLRALKNYITA